MQCIFKILKKILRHITVYLLATTILVASNGLSVHHLYCYCKGKMVTSLFHPDEPCGIAEHQAKQKTCCKSDTCGKMVDEKKHNCSDCTSVFVKLDTKYLPSFFDLKSLDFIAPQRVFCPLVELFASPKSLLRWQQDLPPPPPAGNELLPWIQSYLC